MASVEPDAKTRPAKRGWAEPGETVAMSRPEADPVDVHAARCPHGLPDPRHTAPAVRSTRSCPRLRGVCAPHRRQSSLITVQLVRSSGLVARWSL